MSNVTKSVGVREYSVFFLLIAAGCSRRSPGEARTEPVAPTLREAVPSPVVVPHVPDASAVSARPGPSVPVSSASVGGPSAAPRDLPPAHPCGIAVSLAPGYTSDDCLELERSFRYDEKGRLVESPDAKYTYGAGREGTRTRGGRTSKLLFDAAGRLIQDGAERHRYDTLGRLVRSESGGRFLATFTPPTTPTRRPTIIPIATSSASPIVSRSRATRKVASPAIATTIAASTRSRAPSATVTARRTSSKSSMSTFNPTRPSTPP